MMEHADRLQAVLDAPDDDAPRLAYAAWCDDQADVVSSARAELIRAQLERAQMAPADVEAGQALTLDLRIKALLDQHRSTFAQPLAGSVRAAHFLRGFVGWIELSAQQWLDHGAKILARAPVQHLNLTGVRDVDEALFDSPQLAGIRSLSMNDCGLHDIHVQLLAASPHLAQLRWLSLARNDLGLAAAEALAASPGLPALAFVDLESNPVDPREELGHDAGVLVASSMPADGKAIEARFGYRRWLHPQLAPGRFDAGDASARP